MDLLSHFEECNGFIRNGKKVLVHCFVGKFLSSVRTTLFFAYIVSELIPIMYLYCDRKIAKRNNRSGVLDE